MKVDHEELKAAAMPLIELIRELGNPHTTVIVTDTHVKVVSDEIGCNVEWPDLN